MIKPTQKEEINFRIADCIQTLVEAVDEAGGCPALSRMFEMTMFDFVMTIAGPNNIKFVFHKVPTKIPTGLRGNVE
jgi:hypothetical protein